MNDIEILEEYIKELNKNKKKHELAYSTSFGKYWSDFGKAIENLIQRNKNLEQIEKEHKEENGRLRDRIKELEEYANWHIEHLTEDIADYIDDDKVGNASIIGDFKEEREHWRDINRILNNKKTYIDYKNY